MKSKKVHKKGDEKRSGWDEFFDSDSVFGNDFFDGWDDSKPQQRDFDESQYLLISPANSTHLMKSLEEYKLGKVKNIPLRDD